MKKYARHFQTMPAAIARSDSAIAQYAWPAMAAAPPASTDWSAGTPSTTSVPTASVPGGTRLPSPIHANR